MIIGFAFWKDYGRITPGQGDKAPDKTLAKLENCFLFHK